MARRPARRVPFQRAAAALVFCLCLVPSRQASFAGASPTVAIISDGSHSDAFGRVVGALCKAESMGGEASGSKASGSSGSGSSGSASSGSGIEASISSGHSSISSGHSSSKSRSTSKSEGNYCRHFDNAYEVSSLLTREPQALAAVVAEVRGWINGRGEVDCHRPKKKTFLPISLAVLVSNHLHFSNLNRQDLSLLFELPTASKMISNQTGRRPCNARR